MTREQLLGRLATLEGELRAAGIGALYLFGSRALGQGLASDVDLAFDVDGRRSFSLLDQCEIRETLMTALGTRVDFVERAAMRPRVADHAADGMIRVFG